MTRMQQEYVSISILLIISAGMTEEEARTKYIEIHEQYKMANNEMMTLRKLSEVQPGSKESLTLGSLGRLPPATRTLLPVPKIY